MLVEATRAPRLKKTKPLNLKIASTQKEITKRDLLPPQIYQVLPSLFISSYEVSKDLDLLKSRNITHILNLAGESKCPNQFKSSFNYYSLKMPDNPKVDLIFFVYFAVDFIKNAINDKGNVLVHCVKGTSRSAAIAIAYLILEGLSETEAYSKVSSCNPNIDPNFGFICQLKELTKARDGIFVYSSKYDMFVNEGDCEKCVIEIKNEKCSLSIDMYTCEKVKERAFSSLVLWWKYNKTNF